MMKKYTNFILVLLLCLIFGVVFIRNDELVNSFAAKMFYFYFISIIVFFAVSFNLIFLKKDIKISLNKLDFLILLYYGYNFIRLIFTEHVPIYNDKFIILTFLIGYYFLFKIFFINSKLDKNYIIVALIVSFCLASFLQSLIGLFQVHSLFGFHSGYFKSVGSFDNPSPYSGFVVSTLPFALGLYVFFTKSSKQCIILKYVGLLTFIVGVLVLPHTKIRGDWLALLGGIFVVLYYKYELKKKYKAIFNNKIKTVALVISTISLLALLIVGLYNIRPASAFGRLLIWKVSANIIVDYPIFGAGFNRYEQIYNNYQADYFAKNKRDEFEIYVADDVRYAHNDFIEQFAELGIIGLLLFVSIIINSFFEKGTLSNSNEINPTAITQLQILVILSKSSLVTIVVSSFFAFPFQILPTTINFIFLLSISSQSSYEKDKEGINTQMRKGLVKVGGIILLTLLVTFTYIVVKQYEANKKWKEAKKLSLIANYKNAIKTYSKIYAEYKSDGLFLLNYGGTLSLAGEHKKALIKLEEATRNNSSNKLYILLGNSYTALEEYEIAERYYKHSSNIIPNRLYPKYMLVKSYVNGNEIGKAKRLAIEILNMKEKISSNATNQIKNEIREILNCLTRQNSNH